MPALPLSLAEAWLVAIRDGRVSTADAACWAQLRVEEGGADGLMQKLARCTSERTLHEWALKEPWRQLLPLPYGFRAPLQTRDGGVAMGTLHCLLPHEVFSVLAEKAPRVFDELFGAPAACEHFWAEMHRAAQEMPDGHRAEEHRLWLQRHPMQHAAPQRRIPVGIHGDAGQMHGGEKITAVSWGGLCRRGTTLDTRLLFIVVKHSEAVAGHATLYRAFETLTWSMGALVTGIHPACDERGEPFGPDHHPERAARAGQPLAPGPHGPRCGAWSELRGDWEFLRDALGLRHHYGVRENFCHLCDATQTAGPLFFGDNFADGPARLTLVGPYHTGRNSWAARHPVSPLTRLPGFSIWRCQFDMMHTVELGILQRLIPAALQGLMGIPPGQAVARVSEANAAFKGRSKQAQCLAATLEYRKWAAAKKVPHGSRVKRITVRWVKGSYPDISTEHAKAAALRAMLPWVAEMAEAHVHKLAGLGGNLRVAQLTACCLTAMAKLDETYTRQPRFLTAGQAQQAATHCTEAMQALAELTRLLPAGPFRLTPKCHALQHLTWDNALQNPRQMHCYQDEDFVGLMKRTYTACHGATAPLRTVQRYCLGTSMQLAVREQLLQGMRAPKVGRAGRGGPVRSAPASSGPPSGGLPSACNHEAGSLAPAKRGRGRPPKPPVAKRPRGRPRKVR